MLVLSRKEGESITFPEIDVEVRVIGLRKSKVQLGIEAPQDITVNRGEQAQRVPRKEFGSSRADQMAAELVRLETAVIALAEMASRTDRDEAGRIAGEAMERIAGIKRSTPFASCKDTEPKSISELVTVRTDVIDRLRIGEPEEAQSADRVRQSPAGYSVVSTVVNVA
jgi:carbon storage regulator CsrA